MRLRPNVQDRIRGVNGTNETAFGGDGLERSSQNVTSK